MQRIFFGMHHDEAHIHYIAHQQICADRVVPTIEVGTHATFQTFGLPHINHVAILIQIHIHSRGFRKRKNLTAQLCARTVITNIFGGAVGCYLDIESACLID